MRMIWAFLALPFIEIALFVLVGQAVGVWGVLGLVLLSTLAGVLVMRDQGARALGDLRRPMNGLSDPAEPMARGALAMIAGMLLFVPGFFTSALGLLLLIPAVRGLVLARMSARVTMTGFGFDGRSQGAGDALRPDIIDADFTEIDPDARPLPRSTEKRSGWTEQ